MTEFNNLTREDWADLTERVFALSFGFTPRTREQRHADEEAARVRRAAERRATEEAHAATLTTATGLRRAILELHAPTWFDHSHVGGGHCGGCEFEPNYEGEAIDWPCQTYTLARDWA